MLRNTRYRILAACAFFVALPFLSQAVLALMGELPFTPFRVLPAIGASLFMILLFGLAPRLAYGKVDPAVRGQQREMGFSDEGITLRAGAEQAAVDWKLYLKFVETSRLFLLYPSETEFTIIPKRAFASPDDLQAVREMARRRL